jgi:hypothetical protein
LKFESLTYKEKYINTPKLEITKQQNAFKTSIKHPNQTSKNIKNNKIESNIKNKNISNKTNIKIKIKISK